MMNLLEMNWLEYPENEPTESGYYIAIYQHEEHQVDYFKAIFWSSIKKQWSPWRPTLNLPNSCIKKYLPETRNNYYAPCMVNFSKMIGEL